MGQQGMGVGSGEGQRSLSEKWPLSRNLRREVELRDDWREQGRNWQRHRILESALEFPLC
jgi:hypothetical protein